MLLFLNFHHLNKILLLMLCDKEAEIEKLKAEMGKN